MQARRLDTPCGEPAGHGVEVPRTKQRRSLLCTLFYTQLILLLHAGSLQRLKQHTTETQNKTNHVPAFL